MAKQWQCDDCGARYAVAWLSHCPRCEAMPRPRRAQAKGRSRSMAKITLGGASNVHDGELPQELDVALGPVLEDEAIFEPLPGITDEVVTKVQVSEPVAAPAKPESAPPVVEAAPEPVATPASPLDAIVAASQKGLPA